VVRVKQYSQRLQSNPRRKNPCKACASHVANGKGQEKIDKEIEEKMPRLEKMGITLQNINDVLDTNKLVPGNDVIFQHQL